MSLKPRKESRIRVLLTDYDTSKSKSFTIYGLSLDEVFNKLRAQISKEDNKGG